MIEALAARKNLIGFPGYAVASKGKRVLMKFMRICSLGVLSLIACWATAQAEFKWPPDGAKAAIGPTDRGEFCADEKCGEKAVKCCEAQMNKDLNDYRRDHPNAQGHFDTVKTGYCGDEPTRFTCKVYIWWK
jgi:hypothetical protein